MVDGVAHFARVDGGRHELEADALWQNHERVGLVAPQRHQQEIVHVAAPDRHLLQRAAAALEQPIQQAAIVNQLRNAIEARSEQQESRRKQTSTLRAQSMKCCGQSTKSSVKQ